MDMFGFLKNYRSGIKHELVLTSNRKTIYLHDKSVIVVYVI